MSESTAPAHTPPAPTVSTTPTEIAKGVFLLEDRGVELVPNVGIVVGDRATLVIDTGLGRANGEAVHAIATELGDGRPLVVTLTHWHPEHATGMQAFADATIVYNRTQRDEARQKLAGYVGMFGQFGETVAAALAGAEHVDPGVVHDGGAEIDLGGRVVQLRTWGPAHTREDQGIYLPDERILFLGDLIERRSFPILSYFPPLDAEVDARRWLSVLEAIEGMDVDQVVPGHGPLGGLEALAPTKAYLSLILSETMRRADAGEAPEQVVGAVVPELIARFPEWDAPPEFLLAAGVQSVLALRS